MKIIRFLFILILIAINATTHASNIPQIGVPFHLKSSLTEKYVDVAEYSKANGGVIHMWDFHGDINQQFRFEPSKEVGYQYIVAVNSGLALTIPQGNSEDGIQVRQYAKTGNANQLFYVAPIEKSPEHFLLINKQSNKPLETEHKRENGARLIQSEQGRGTRTQWFRFETVANVTPPPSPVFPQGEEPYFPAQNELPPGPWQDQCWLPRFEGHYLVTSCDIDIGGKAYTRWDMTQSFGPLIVCRGDLTDEPNCNTGSPELPGNTLPGGPWRQFCDFVRWEAGPTIVAMCPNDDNRLEEVRIDAPYFRPSLMACDLDIVEGEDGAVCWDYTPDMVLNARATPPIVAPPFVVLEKTKEPVTEPRRELNTSELFPKFIQGNAYFRITNYNKELNGFALDRFDLSRPQDPDSQVKMRRINRFIPNAWRVEQNVGQYWRLAAYKVVNGERVYRIVQDISGMHKALSTNSNAEAPFASSFKVDDYQLWRVRLSSDGLVSFINEGLRLQNSRLLELAADLVTKELFFSESRNFNNNVWHIESLISRNDVFTSPSLNGISRILSIDGARELCWYSLASISPIPRLKTCGQNEGMGTNFQIVRHLDNTHYLIKVSATEALYWGGVSSVPTELRSDTTETTYMWTIRSVGNGNYQLINLQTGEALTRVGSDDVKHRAPQNSVDQFWRLR